MQLGEVIVGDAVEERDGVKIGRSDRHGRPPRRAGDARRRAAWEPRALSRSSLRARLPRRIRAAPRLGRGRPVAWHRRAVTWRGPTSPPAPRKSPPCPHAAQPLLASPTPSPSTGSAASTSSPRVRALLAEARARLEAAARTARRARPAPTTTPWARSRPITERLELAMAVVAHLESVATTPELRAAYNAVQPEVSAFYSSITLSAGVWSAIKAFAATEEARGAHRRAAALPRQDHRRLPAQRRRPRSRRQGAALRRSTWSSRTLTLRYAQNVLDATNAFELVVDDAARARRAARAGGRGRPRERGAEGRSPGYRFTLQAPSYTPVLTYLDDAAVRERLYRAFTTRARRGRARQPPARRPHPRAAPGEGGAPRLRELRRPGARGSHGEDRRGRAPLPRDARREDRALLRPRERGARTPSAASSRARGAPEIMPWDVAYYAEKLRRARFDFDEEALRPYFPLDRVLEGLFEIARRLYGVRVEPWEGAPVWHPSVRAFVLREADGAAGAAFYVDVAPARVQARRRLDERPPHRRPRRAAPLPPPGGARGQPHAARSRAAPRCSATARSRRMFHEFGHLDAPRRRAASPVRSLAGTAVAWDFVELPSQIMENWCWEREALDLFARHYETGETIPEELLARMRAARTFRAANAMMRQLGFAEVDLGAAHGLPPRRARRRDRLVARHPPALLGRRPCPTTTRWSPPSPTSSRAPSATPPATTRTSGPRSSTPTPSPASSARASSTPRWAQAFRAGILARGDSEDPMRSLPRLHGPRARPRRAPRARRARRRTAAA